MPETTVSCPHCGQLMLVDTAHVGADAQCPGCQREFTIPSAYQPPREGFATAAGDWTRPVQYAGFWLRFGAAFIDGIITGLIGLVGGGILGGVLGFLMAAQGMNVNQITFAAERLGNLLGLIVGWLYFTLLESSEKQSTFGKRMLSLRVTDLAGQRISWARANGRYWGKFISTLTLLIGYFMAGFTEKKQALHDIMAGTLVVRD